jgi:adenine-specific DNA-methyltransferase
VRQTGVGLAFMAIVLSALVKDGQMIAIVPRSFTNGLYFKGFRNFLLKYFNIELIHIFKSRNKVFSNLDVLQENIICKITKTKQKQKITISVSTSSDDLPKSINKKYSKQLIIDSVYGHDLIRIPESEKQGEILKLTESWTDTFEGLGYFISTGPVVEFRTRKNIHNKSEKNSVPLLRMHNIKPFNTVWTGTDKKDAMFRLEGEYLKHVTKNSNYVILKRFSAKDEKRRLVAGIYLNKNINNSQYVGLENHLNYIGRQNAELTETEAFGIAGLFNSGFYDEYFRCISGNTQVNATEIRLLRLPPREVIKNIGKNLKSSKDLTQRYIDSVVNDYLGI